MDTVPVRDSTEEEPQEYQCTLTSNHRASGLQRAVAISVSLHRGTAHTPVIRLLM